MEKLNLGDAVAYAWYDVYRDRWHLKETTVTGISRKSVFTKRGRFSKWDAICKDKSGRPVSGNGGTPEKPLTLKENLS